MLDGHNKVVAHKTEIAYDVFPVKLIVAVAYGTENPRAVSFVGIVLSVKDAEFSGVVLVNLGVLRMEVIDSTLKLADSGYGVDALPDEVRGVEVCADDVADCGAELKKSLGVINTEPGVHFKCNLGYTVSKTELCGLFPIRDENLVPLIVKHGKEVVGPSAGCPVGRLVLGTTAGTAGEGDNGVDAELLCKKNCVGKVVVELLGYSLVRVDGVAVDGKRANLKVVTLHSVAPFLKCCVRREKHLGVTVCLAGITAATDFDCVDAELFKFCKSFIEGKSCKKVSKYAEFHGNFSFFVISTVYIITDFLGECNIYFYFRANLLTIL